MCTGIINHTRVLLVYVATNRYKLNCFGMSCFLLKNWRIVIDKEAKFIFLQYEVLWETVHLSRKIEMFGEWLLFVMLRSLPSPQQKLDHVDPGSMYRNRSGVLVDGIGRVLLHISLNHLFLSALLLFVHILVWYGFGHMCSIQSYVLWAPSVLMDAFCP